METLTIESDIPVFCITATSFPEGVLRAHQTLHAYVPYDKQRKYFGIAIPDAQGKLTYKAAANELEAGDLSKHQLEAFIIPKGTYVFLDVNDFMKNIPAIGDAFKVLMTASNLDPSGIGIEWYLGTDTCRCMMKLR